MMPMGAPGPGPGAGQQMPDPAEVEQQLTMVIGKLRQVAAQAGLDFDAIVAKSAGATGKGKMPPPPGLKPGPGGPPPGRPPMPMG
jgi:hypothetical protein